MINNETGSSENADRELLKRQADTLYGLFENKSRSFRRAFAGVVLLATAVFGLIIWPYTNFRGEQFELEAQKVRLETALARAQADEDEFSTQLEWFDETYRQTYDDIDGVLQQVDDEYNSHNRDLAMARDILADNAEARAWLAGEADRPQLSDFTLGTDRRLREFDRDECFWFDGEQWWRCHLGRALHAMTNGTRRYGQGHVSHLRNDMVQPLTATLSAMYARFGSWLAGEVGSWHEDADSTSAYSASEFSDFTDHVRHAINEHLHELKYRHGQLEKNVSTLEEQIAVTETEIADIKAKIAEIDSLENINTPLGALPIGLNDFVMVFPLLLAAGLYLCVSLFFDSLRLRQSFHRISHSLDAEIFRDKYVALVAPLWIDPLKGSGQGVLRALILFLPAFVFLATMILLLKNRLLWGEFMAEVRLSAWVYYVAYVLSTGLFVEGARRILRIFRH